MTDLFLEREWSERLTPAEVIDMGENLPDCFDLYRVQWQESMLSMDGSRLVCRFSGPDAESVRLALRQAEADLTMHWPGTVHDAPELKPDDLRAANVVVERKFDDPTAIADVQAQEDDNIGCLETHGVKFVRTFFSLDLRRMICLYLAPDAESVRIAQRQANMPVDKVWAGRHLDPSSD
jgi:hypothetical protein